jgi:hypothetical protein
MSIRSLLVAVPFALGIACSHSAKSHASSSGSGSSGAQASAPYGDVVTTAGTATEKAGTGTSAEGSAGSSSSAGSQDSQSGTGSGSTMGGEHKGSEMGSGGSSESMGSDKSAEGGSASAAAGAGETVAGKLTKVSKSEVTIAPKDGSPMTLKIGDQTVVTMNGKSAKPSQLKKGQSVHASYAEEGGAEIATKIDISSGKHHKGSSHPQGTGSGGSDMGGEHKGDMGSGSGSSQ